MAKKPHHRTNKHKTKKTKTQPTLDQTLNEHSTDDPAYTGDDNIIDGDPGQHFHMDFGFVGGSGYKIKN